MSALMFGPLRVLALSQGPLVSPCPLRSRQADLQPNVAPSWEASKGSLVHGQSRRHSDDCGHSSQSGSETLDDQGHNSALANQDRSCSKASVWLSVESLRGHLGSRRTGHEPNRRSDRHCCALLDHHQRTLETGCACRRERHPPAPWGYAGLVPVEHYGTAADVAAVGRFARSARLHGRAGEGGEFAWVMWAIRSVGVGAAAPSERSRRRGPRF